MWLHCIYRVLWVSLASQMGIYLLPVTQNLVWHKLIKSCFIQRYTFQHYSNMFKLNKHAKYLYLTTSNQLMWIESNSTFLMCIKVCKLIALLLAFSAILPSPQLLRHEADIVASYHIAPYLQSCHASVVTSNVVYNYWKCYINVVTRTCSGYYWLIRTLSR